MFKLSLSLKPLVTRYSDKWEPIKPSAPVINTLLIFLISNENKFPVKSTFGFLETVKEAGKKGVNIQRYKGLGEMNPEQLWETTLDPEKRILLKVGIEEETDIENTFVDLMGEKVEKRREYIQANAKKVVNLDI